jgi:serine/threonine protein kinase
VEWGASRTVSIETFGKYQLLKRLAMGGMAQIYLARQRGPEGFEKLLVVKRILPHLAENDEFVRMFLDEARIAARLDHPNIVQIYDLGSQDDSFFIAMEYIHGEDLRRVWKRAERSGQLIPVPLVCRIMIEACAGLDHAHKKADGSGKPLNIVHRDISPQNILLTFEGRVKVVDFGIAKAADQATVTRSGVLKGKYSYMSPEQAAGQKVDCRSDIFALGVVLYELLTGARLFKRTTDMATLQAVAQCDILPPSRLNPRVPEDLDPIVMKALAREPGDRYADALQLQLALEDWLVAHQLPSSTAHVAAFMQDLYAARLAEEARLGDVLVEEAEALSPPAARASDKAERSAAGTMAAPRQVDTNPSAPRRESTDRLERTPRTSGKYPRSEPRSTPSERKLTTQEPRRTVDIRRAPAPDAEESPGSESTEMLVARPSRSRQPAVAEPPPARAPERKSNRLAVMGVGGGVLVGLLLGGWWALRSEHAPEAGTETARPSTEPAPREEPAQPPPAQPEPPREDPKPSVVAGAVQDPPKTTPEQPVPPVDGKPSGKSPGVAAPAREEHKPERPATTVVERPAAQRGTVRFAVTPWAEVSCGGRQLGTTPLPDVSLAAGVYECKFSNPELGIRTQRVEVKPNAHTRVRVKF